MGLSFSDIADFGADLLGLDSDNKANEANMKMNKKRLEWDKYLANNQMLIRAGDAKRSGIHPLYAIGAGTHTPNAQFIGAEGQGDAIRNIGSKLANRSNQKALQDLQKKNIEADIALKMARASEVAKRTSKINSQQDQDIIGLEMHGGTIKSKARDKAVKTPLGKQFKLGHDTPVQLFEEEYGQVAAELYGFQRYLKDRNFFNSQKLGKEFFRLMRAASSRGAKSQKAKMVYKANRLLFGKYFADYMRSRQRR